MTKPAPGQIHPAMRMLLAAALLSLMGCLAELRAAECPLSPLLPGFEVKIGSPAVSYDFNEDRAAMRKFAADDSVQVGKGHAAVGLTTMAYDFTVTTQTDTAHSGDGYCASLRSVVVNLGIKALKVMVDRRYQAGSCERQAVLDHENKHVAIIREAPRYYASDVGAKVEALARSSVLEVKTLEEARTAYAHAIRSELQPLFKAIRERAAERNAQLDEKEGDAAKLRRCEHW